LCSEDLSN